MAERDRGPVRPSRHRAIPLPFGGGALLLWGREADWSYLVDPLGTCTLSYHAGPDASAKRFVFRRKAYPSQLLAILEGAERTDASIAAERLRALCGGRKATLLADSAMLRWTRRDALAFAGPDGEALAARIAAARALDLSNAPDPDPKVETYREVTSPAFIYASLDPRAIGRRAATRTGRWPASDGRIARLMRGERPVDDLALLCALASLPEDWDPASEPAWDALRGLVRATEPLARLLGHFDFLAPSKGRWEPYLDAFGGPDVLAARVWEAVDMARALARHVAVPALHRAGLAGDLAPTTRDAPATAVAAGMLVADKGLSSILSLAGDWHARRQGIDAEAELGSENDEGWPAPFPPVAAPNGVLLVPLSTARDLREEGDRESGLDHCVGGYVDACATGASVILSVRAPAEGGGRRLSTVELVRRKDVLTLQQHRGRSNQDPPPEADRAVAWLQLRLARGEIAPSREYLAHAWRSRLGRRPYDPRSDIAFARAVRAWAPLLPRPMRSPEGAASAAVSACEALVRLRTGPGERPLLGPFGLLSDTPLSLYPPPLRGDLVTAGRISAIDGLRAALSIATRRIPPGLRDRLEPVILVTLLVALLIASGLAASWALMSLGLSAWHALPIAVVAAPLALALPILMPPGERRRAAFARRLRRAKAAPGGLRAPRLA